MINRRFIITVLLTAAFVMPSLGHAWSFIDQDDTLKKSNDSCWTITTVQSQECEGEDCPESGAIELPSEAEEEPDCE